MAKITLEGLVSLEPFAAGSKSDHKAYLLNLENKPQNIPYDALKLCYKGGNPFTEPRFNGLEGKYIKAEGVVHGYTFIIDSHTILKNKK